MKLNEAKTLASLQINADMDAAELDALLRKLALMRAAMTPTVPLQLETPQELEHPMLQEVDPALVMVPLRDGCCRLVFRHQGFGWLAYQINRHTVAGLAASLNNITNGDGINPFEQHVTHRH